MDIKSVVSNFIQKTGFSSRVLFDEDIAPRTTFKIGGKAACYVEPEDAFQFQDIIALSKKYSIPRFVLGGGSNIVFQDDYYEGIVISTAALKDINVEFREDSNEAYVCCDSGVSVGDLVKYCTEHNLRGLERFAGLPGTVGGAVYMNARCFDVSISSLFVSAYVLDMQTFESEDVLYNESEWSYKVSPFQGKDKMIFQAVFKLEKCAEGEGEKLRSENEYYIEERRKRGHFDFPSAGSVFKNNRAFGQPSGKIVDECGLRGLKIGQAQVAPFHGNFIINLGGATQKDVKNLVDYVVNTVREKKGFVLEPEIIFC